MRAVCSAVNLGALLVVLTGCSSDRLDTTRSIVAQGIRGGQLDPDHPAVGIVMTDSFCSGSLVAPSKVLTAAHCVAEETHGTFIMGPDMDHIDRSLRFTAAVRHPGYIDNDDLDLAVLTLSAAVHDVTPLAVRAAPLDADVLEQDLTIVGYGRPSTDSEDVGTRRKALLRFNALGVEQLHYSVEENSGRTALNGDSGGPALLDDGGEEVVVGVAHGGFEFFGSVTDGYYTRVDTAVGWLQEQGVPAVACLPEDDCGAGAGCAHGSCLGDHVTPCLINGDHGCPDDLACRIGLDVAGDSVTRCSAAATAQENQPCGIDLDCTDSNLVCAPDAPGASTGTCRWKCGRTAPSCAVGGVCWPLPGRLDVGFCEGDPEVVCAGPDDCAAPMPHCHEARCVQCLAHEDCTGDEICTQNNLCGLAANGPCSNEASCGGDTPRCDLTAGHCVGCLGDADCPLLSTCQGNLCVEPPPVDCQPGTSVGCPDGQVCTIDFDRYILTCVDGAGVVGARQPCAEHGDCLPGFSCMADICMQLCNSATSEPCSPGTQCLVMGNIAPWGVCNHCRSDDDCLSEASPRCEPAQLLCYTCVDDVHCARGQTCLDGACAGEPLCESDADCDSPTSHCVTESGLCVACLEDDDCRPGTECRDHVCVEWSIEPPPPPEDPGCGCRAVSGPPRLGGDLPATLACWLLLGAIRLRRWCARCS